mgnify:FL=1|tara:strand:- start:139 stop:1380 length:1242 start_codon:yes stop_codon:yes gene_type:complete
MAKLKKIVTSLKKMTPSQKRSQNLYARRPDKFITPRDEAIMGKGINRGKTIGDKADFKQRLKKANATKAADKNPTPNNIRKYAALHGKAKTIKRYGKEGTDLALEFMSKKKIGGSKMKKAGGPVIRKKKAGKILKNIRDFAEDKKDKLVKEIKSTPRDLMPRPKTGSGKLNKKGVRTGGVVNFKPQKVKQAPKGGSETASGKPLKGGQIATGGKEKDVVGQGVGRKGAGVTSIKKTAGTGKGPTKVTKGGQLKTKKAEKTIAKNQSRARKDKRRRLIKRGAVGAGVVTGLYQLGKAASKKPPMAATDSSSSGGSYKIKSGDTLSQIAKRRGTTLKALLAANPSIKNANKIRVGQTIKMSKPVKKRKSVYQGLSKSTMSKMAMPKKKKMGGGKVVKRGKGGSVGSSLVAGLYDT